MYLLLNQSESKYLEFYPIQHNVRCVSYLHSFEQTDRIRPVSLLFKIVTET